MSRSLLRPWLVGLAVVGATVSSTASAQPSPPDSFTTATQTFAIPAGNLDDALQHWSRTSGIRILVPADLVKGLRTRGLAGTFTPERALGQLLEGTPLNFRASGARTIAVYDTSSGGSGGAQILPPLNVQGQIVDSQHLIGPPPAPFAGGQVAQGVQLGLLGNRDVFDTPFNVTGYTAKVIEDQQARSISEVFANNPSVRTAASSDGVYENMMIRGFPVSTAAFMLNGLPGMSPAQMVAPQYIDRLELMTGPSGLLSNVPLFGSVGGSVNIVPKRATNDPITDITGTFQSTGQPGVQVDFGRRFGNNNEFGVRVNGVFNSGPTAAQYQSTQVGLATVALDYKGERVRLALDLGYQNTEFQAPFLSMLYNGPAGWVPSPPKAGSNPFQPWSFAKASDGWALGRGEFDATDWLTLYAAAGYKEGRSTLLSSYQEIDDATGNTTVYPYFEPYRTQNFAAEVGAKARFETGVISHSVNLAAATHRVSIGYADTFYAGFASNLYQPSTGPMPNYGTLSSDPPTTLRYNLTSFAFSDSLSMLENRIQLTIGGRVQGINADNIDGPTGVVTTSYSSTAVTPAIAFLVKPLSNVSLYGNYIEGLTQGPIAPAGTLNAGTMFAPSVTQQIEAGVKFDWGTWGTTLSLFQITQPNGIVDSTTNLFAVNGLQRNRGLEINVFGEPLSGVRVLGGVTFLRGEQLQTADGLNNGRIAPGVPGIQVNLNGEYDVPFMPGFTLTGRMIYTSMQYLDAANTQMLPDWTRFDVGARYTHEIGKTPMIFRVNVENVANASYWSSAQGGVLSMGMPRRVLLSATAKF